MNRRTLAKLILALALSCPVSGCVVSPLPFSGDHNPTLPGDGLKRPTDGQQKPKQAQTVLSALADCVQSNPDRFATTDDITGVIRSLGKLGYITADQQSAAEAAIGKDRRKTELPRDADSLRGVR